MSGRRGEFARGELARALPRAIDGFTALERDVEVDGRRTADLLGVDRRGRAWLVVLTRGGDKGLARVLGALALARAGAAPLVDLARAVAERALWERADREPSAEDEDPPRIDARAPVGVAVVVPADAARFQAEVLPLVAQGLLVLRAQRIAGRTASIARLEAVRGPAAATAAFARPEAPLEQGEHGPLGSRSLDAFLAALPEAEARLAADLVQRLARLDGALEPEVWPRGVVWSFGGRALCALELSEGRLEARALPGRAVPLTDGAALERFVAAVLERYLSLAARGLAGNAQDEDPEDDGLGPLPDADLLPRRAPQVLTREEIEAFRE